MTARKPPPGGLFVAAWPIEDVDRTYGELRAEAEADLADMLFDHEIESLGVPQWRTVGNPDGWVWLVALIPVAPWRDPVRYRNRRATLSAGVAS